MAESITLSTEAFLAPSLGADEPTSPSLKVVADVVDNVRKTREVVFSSNDPTIDRGFSHGFDVEDDLPSCVLFVYSSESSVICNKPLGGAGCCIIEDNRILKVDDVKLVFVHRALVRNAAGALLQCTIIIESNMNISPTKHNRRVVA